MLPRGFVHFLANKPFGTIYIGVTSGLTFRVWQHKQGVASAFTRRYRVNKLVHYEEFESITEAIHRETMKRWRRDWKIDLINRFNPEWKDLAVDWYRVYRARTRARWVGGSRPPMTFFVGGPLAHARFITN